MSKAAWHPTKLGDEVGLLTGYPFESKHYSESVGSIRLLRGDNVVQGALRWDGVKCWPQDKAIDVEAYRLAAGDVVLAMDRPWIEAGLKYAAINRSDLPCLLVQRVARLRGGPRVSTGFLRYLIGSKEFTDHVLAVQTGTAVPHISGGQIKAFQFLLPPKPVQERIADILGSLDDKIELNRRTNETLEAMARAVFRSWFVDFDPVRARADGQKPQGMDTATVKLFPDSFEMSRIGRVPSGWQVVPIGEHIEAVKGLSYKGEGLAESGMPLHNLNSVYEGGGYKYEGIKFYTGEYKDRYLVRPGDVIVTNTEQGHDLLLIGYPAIVPKFYGESGLFSHHLYRVRPRESSPLTNHFIYFQLMDRRFRDEVTGHTNGTTVNMLAADGLQRPLFALPPRELIQAFDRFVAPLFQKAQQLHGESLDLKRTRDALLPKLLSGEVRVGSSEGVRHA